jgi:hypothetical protein
MQTCARYSTWLRRYRRDKNVPSRPKTNALDPVWLAKLTKKGLRPSFVPPAEIRRRDYARLREDLAHERTRYWQRLENHTPTRSDSASMSGGGCRTAADPLP